MKQNKNTSKWKRVASLGFDTSNKHGMRDHYSYRADASHNQGCARGYDYGRVVSISINQSIGEKS